MLKVDHQLPLVTNGCHKQSLNQQYEAYFGGFTVGGEQFQNFEDATLVILGYKYSSLSTSQFAGDNREFEVAYSEVFTHYGWIPNFQDGED